MAAGTDPLSAELLVTVERALLNAIEGALPEEHDVGVRYKAELEL